MIPLLSRHADVQRHFAGAGAPRIDRRLFAHLKGCARCRDEYSTLAMMEELENGGAARARERLARGLFPHEPVRAARPRLFAGGFALGAACLALLFTVGRTPSPFRARGSVESGAMSGAALAIYRVPRDQHRPEALAVDNAQRAGATLRAGESLAFSYVNPASVGACCLMVFGRDPAGRVYWFWPAWNDASQDPTSVPISQGGTATAPVELPEAVRHPLQVGPLTIVGLFTPRPLHVREVEAAVAKGLEGLQSFEGHVWTETLEVTP